VLVELSLNDLVKAAIDGGKTFVHLFAETADLIVQLGAEAADLIAHVGAGGAMRALCGTGLSSGDGSLVVRCTPFTCSLDRGKAIDL
jgi:hypothetical protein